MKKKYRFDIALSYAGEDRDYVQKVYEALKSSGDLKIFYDQDPDIKIELIGQRASEYFYETFREQARYTAIFISKYYVAKSWPLHESSASINRMIKERTDSVLIFKFDESTLKGLPEDIIYVKIEESPEVLAGMIKQKITGKITATDTIKLIAHSITDEEEYQVERKRFFWNEGPSVFNKEIDKIYSSIENKFNELNNEKQKLGVELSLYDNKLYIRRSYQKKEFSMIVSWEIKAQNEIEDALLIIEIFEGRISFPNKKEHSLFNKVTKIKSIEFSPNISKERHPIWSALKPSYYSNSKRRKLNEAAKLTLRNKKTEPNKTSTELADFIMNIFLNLFAQPRGVRDIHL